MITLKQYTPFKQRSIGKKIAEAVVSAMMFVITWIGLVFALGIVK